MKANELRIGNWVMIDPHNFPQQVCDVMCDSVNTKSDRGAHYGLVDAIPLTEEWLLKFGFQIKDQLSIHKTKVYYISGIDVDYCLYFADFRQDFGFYIEYTDSPFDKDLGVLYPIAFGIKYVHQLQNLYFALTDEELTYGDNK
jgi:hypothetical protein